MPMDPVCGMTVEQEHAFACTDYKDKHYCFCSQECKDEFDEAPEDYVAAEGFIGEVRGEQ